MEKVIISSEACVGCGLCVGDCVSGVLQIENGKAKVNSSGCISCGHCFAICPNHAVTMPELEEDNGPFAQMSDLDTSLLLQAMKSRRTIRRFADRKVEPQKVGMILEAGRYCPTGTNAQDVAYTILGSKQNEIEALCVSLIKKGLGAAGLVSETAKNFKVDDKFFFKGAPLVIVVSGKSTVNAALASSYMEIMAESLGLGVLYSGFFVACAKLSAKLRGMLDLPSGHKAVTCLVIGYPGVKYYRIPGRKKIQVKTL